MRPSLSIGGVLLFLLLLSSFFSLPSSRKVRTLKQYHPGKNLPPDPSMVILSPKTNYTLPIPIMKRNKNQWRLLKHVLEHFHLLDEDSKKEFWPSIGCGAQTLSKWYENVPHDFCPLSTVLVYSEQHSGTSLLGNYLQKAPHTVGIHELFCCDHCTNKTLAIETLVKLSCSLRVHQRNIQQIVVGLQFNHFWGNLEYALSYPKVHGSKVILMKRDNIIAKKLAGAGLKDKKKTLRINPERKHYLVNITTYIENYQERYRSIYCFLKEVGVEVLVVTYEELAGEFGETMKRVSDFIDVPSGWWNGAQEETIHIPLVDRIRNFEEVKEFMEEHHPEYVCMLTEDCVFSKGFSCDVAPRREVFPYTQEEL